jgi:hypothetical protein
MSKAQERRIESLEAGTKSSRVHVVEKEEDIGAVKAQLAGPGLPEEDDLFIITGVPSR